ncbi:hypothetical protein [Streptomyces sp. NBC_00459]|uniref:hypothetical protein n=1 Tax=Streptomyces sp. NBC_00459 TaxID=2975749 RepID=UPI002E1967DD
MGRKKPNKQKRQRPLFGSLEMDIAVAEAMGMALMSNSISAVAQAHGALSGFMTVRNFASFDDFEAALEWLRDVPVTMFVILPDVIELECRLANLPNIDKGTPLFDPHTRRTARVYRYNNKENN